MKKYSNKLQKFWKCLLPAKKRERIAWQGKTNCIDFFFLIYNFLSIVLETADVVVCVVYLHVGQIRGSTILFVCIVTKQAA